MKDDLKQYQQLSAIAAASCGDDQLTRNILTAIKMRQLKRTDDNKVKSGVDSGQATMAFSNRTAGQEDEFQRSQRKRRQINVSDYIDDNDDSDSEPVDLDDLDDGDDQGVQVDVFAATFERSVETPTAASEPTAAPSDWLYDYLMGQSKLEKTPTATTPDPPKHQQPEQQCSCPPGKLFNPMIKLHDDSLRMLTSVKDFDRPNVFVNCSFVIVSSVV